MLKSGFGCLLASLFSLGCFSVSACGEESTTAGITTNIVLIMADDLGCVENGLQGCRDIFTPNIDLLAASGARFSQGYVAGCMCGPSLARFMTGRIQSTFGY